VGSKRSRLVYEAELTPVAGASHMSSPDYATAQPNLVRDRAQARLREAAKHDVEASTKARYDSVWASYQAFCTTAQISTLPAHLDNVGIFLAYKCENGWTSPDTLSVNLAGLKKIICDLPAVQSAGNWFVDPVQEHALSKAVKGLKRELSLVPAKPAKRPITFVDLRVMLDWLKDEHKADRTTLTGPNALRMEYQYTWLALIAHQAFLRVSEYTGSKLQCKDIHFMDASNHKVSCKHESVAFVELQIRGSKTGKLTNKPQTARLVKRDDSFDTVAYLQRAWRLWDLEAPSHENEPAFCVVNGSGVRHPEQPLSSSNFHAWLVATLVKCGIAKELPGGGHTHGTHSLRAGGATDAFDSGVSQHTILGQGRWTSEAYLTYVRATLRQVKDLAKMH
jgi:hypothetical protein